MNPSPAKPAIQAVVFDAYGTLFDLSSVTSLCMEVFPEQGRILAQLWGAKQLEYTWVRSLMGQYENFWHGTEAALLAACATLHLPCEPKTRSRLMGAYLHLPPYPDVEPALLALSPYPLAVLSNGSPGMLETVVRNAGLQGRFAHLLSVDEVRIYKPSPRAYQLAAEKLRVDPAAVAYVSANSWDVAGAKAFGFWSCWVNRANAAGEELGFPADAVIPGLGKLVSPACLGVGLC